MIKSRYQLRTLFMIIGVVASLVAISAHYRAMALRERAAADQINALGGIVEWEERALGWRWLYPRVCVRVSLEGAHESAQSLAVLKEMRYLRWIYIVGTDADDTTLKAIADCSNLEVLNVSRTRITDEGVKQLRACRKLKNLRMSRTNVTGECFTSLAKLPTLEEVDASSCPLSDSAVEQIAALPTLRSFRAWHCGLTDRSVDALCQAPNLADGYVGGVFSEKAIERLSAKPGRRHLSAHAIEDCLDGQHNVPDGVSR